MQNKNRRIAHGRLAVLLCVLVPALIAAMTSLAAADGLVAPAGAFGAALDDGEYPTAFGGSGDAGGSGPAAGGAPGPTLPYNASVMDQSAFAMGKMTWNVIMLESNGLIDANVENWTPAEITTIQNEINQAKSFWEGLTAGFHPGARLSIDVHYENGGAPMATNYEPITKSSSQESLWINNAMNSLGFNSASHFTNVRNYNNARRNADGNHWATTIFIVDDTVDSDNRFNNSAFAYAYFNGPFAVLTQGNNGWGINNFSMVLSHEMGHIFGALDEYQGSGVRNTQHAGYLNGLTLNASLDGFGSPVAPPQPNALMLNNGSFSSGVTYMPHSSASVNFGHRDIDSDGIPDILDMGSELIGDDVASDSLHGDFVFNGSISVNVYINANPLNVGFSNSLADMTINTIVGAAYSLDGGPPTPLAPLDSAYDDYVESLGFTIFGLHRGPHTIDIVGVDSVGNPSNVLHFDFHSQFVPEPSAILLALFAMLGATNLRHTRARGLRAVQGS